MGTGEAKASIMKKLVQYVLSDDVQSNASAFNYASMSPDTVRPCYWLSRVVVSLQKHRASTLVRFRFLLGTTLGTLACVLCWTPSQMDVSLQRLSSFFSFS